MFAIKKQIKILSILFLCLCGGISFSFADASVKKFEFKKAGSTQEIASDADGNGENIQTPDFFRIR